MVVAAMHMRGKTPAEQEGAQLFLCAKFNMTLPEVTALANELEDTVEEEEDDTLSVRRDDLTAECYRLQQSDAVLCALLDEHRWVLKVTNLSCASS